MTNRERFRAALAFEPIDRMSHVEYGFTEEIYERWREEGLPGDVAIPDVTYLSKKYDVFKYFNIAKFGYILHDQYFSPKFEYELVEETDEFRIERNEKGVLQKVSKKSVTIPQYLDYPIKSGKDYDELKERLLAVNLKQRYPADWDQLSRKMKEQQDTIVCTHMDGFFGYPRELMGVEAFLLMFYDEPDVLKEMINDRVNFYLQVYEKAIRDTQPDFAFVWEDMSYKNGPLISPDMFREFMLPAYKKLTSWLRGLGVKNIIVDSDGDIRKLIPLWLEGGVTGLLPFEVTAGMDVLKIAAEFPKLQILGGVNKHEIAKGRQSIDAELSRVLPAMAKRGGFINTLDHWVPTSISLDDFRYYTERVREYRLCN